MKDLLQFSLWSPGKHMIIKFTCGFENLCFHNTRSLGGGIQ